MGYQSPPVREGQVPDIALRNNQGLKTLRDWGIKKDSVSVSLVLGMTKKVEIMVPTPMVGMIMEKGSTVLKKIKEQTGCTSLRMSPQRKGKCRTVVAEVPKKYVGTALQYVLQRLIGRSITELGDGDDDEHGETEGHVGNQS